MPNIIKTSGGSTKYLGNATTSQVLSGATFYSDSKELLTGTMTNNGAISQSLAINGSYTIPKGYHNGSGKVTQSIATLGATTYTPTTSNQTIASGKYLSGAQTIKGDANLVASNIKKGVSIFGISGNVEENSNELWTMRKLTVYIVQNPFTSFTINLPFTIGDLSKTYIVANFAKQRSSGKYSFICYPTLATETISSVPSLETESIGNAVSNFTNTTVTIKYSLSGGLSNSSGCFVNFYIYEFKKNIKSVQHIYSKFSSSEYFDISSNGVLNPNTFNYFTAFFPISTVNPSKSIFIGGVINAYTNTTGSFYAGSGYTISENKIHILNPYGSTCRVNGAIFEFE